MGKALFNGNIGSGYYFTLDDFIYVPATILLRKLCQLLWCHVLWVSAHIQTLDGLLENIFNIQKSVHETPSIIGTTLDSLYIGGITGWTYYTITENCVSARRLEPSETSYAGGIVGVCLFKYVHQLLLLHKPHACKRRLLWQWFQPYHD